MSRFSVTVPASLTVTVSEHGVVYTATGAGIVNNSSSAVQVSGVTLRAENGWTIVPHATNMAEQRLTPSALALRWVGYRLPPLARANCSPPRP